MVQASFSLSISSRILKYDASYKQLVNFRPENIAPWRKKECMVSYGTKVSKIL